MRISDWSSDVCSSDLAPLLSSIRFRSGLRRRRFRWSPAATETRPESGRAGADHGRAQPRATRLPARQKTAVHLRIPSGSEEHTSELQSLMRNSYAVFCLKKKKETYLKSPIRTKVCTTVTSPHIIN